MITIPPYLKKGDTIGITCPAGYMSKDKVQVCIQTLQKWGFQVMVGKTIGSHSKNYFSGTDEERTNEMQAMLNDKKIRAILFGRGGYGMGRIIDRLDFKEFVRNPKWLIGFSDITLLHAHVLSNFNIATIHGPMAAAFNDDKKNKFTDSIRMAITGKKNKIECLFHKNNRKGIANGTLVGGNLALLTNSIGTPSDIDTRNKILFIEDVGEYLYSIDRMMHQLKRSGKFDKISGLIVGGFTDIKDTVRPFGKKWEDLIREIVEEYNFPICFHFPISHSKENYAVKVGIPYQLKVTGKKTTLIEH